MHHRQAGQTAAEYLGVIVLVAAIIGAVMSTGVGSSIAGGLQDAVCRITGGECGSEGGGDPDDPTTVPVDAEGPAFGDGKYPIPDLPWTGSVGLNGNKPIGKTGLYLDATITASEKACTLDAAGNPVVNLNVAGQFKAGGKYGDTKGGTGASVDTYVGKGLNYNLRADPQTAEDLSDGTLPTPSPVNPMTIPEGATLTLTESTFDGMNLTGAYRGLQATMGFEKGREVSSAVQRVDGDTVRVTVGDADYVKNTAGIGFGGLASVGTTDKSTSAQAKTVDIDVSTPAGQAAYTNFVRTGKLPPSGRSVSGTSDIESYTIDQALSAGYDVGPFQGSLDSNLTDQATTVTHPDNTKTYTSYSGGGEITKSTTWEVDADGTETQAPETTIRYGNLSPGEADLLNLYYAGEGLPDDAPDGDLDYSVTLSEDDIAQLQEQAAIAAEQADESGVSSIELENLATAAPGSVPGILQATPTAVADLLGSMRMYVAQTLGDRDEIDRDEFNDLFPDVDPAIADAACS